MDLVLATRPDWSQTINLIKEDDGRSHLVRLETIQRVLSVADCITDLLPNPPINVTKSSELTGKQAKTDDLHPSQSVYVDGCLPGQKAAAAVAQILRPIY